MDNLDIWLLRKMFEFSLKYPGKSEWYYFNLANRSNLPKPIAYILNPELEKQHEALKWLKEIRDGKR